MKRVPPCHETEAAGLLPGGRGMTVLELMIVLAIIAMATVLVRSGFRMITKADLVEDSTELAAVLRRASSLAIEQGELHRVVLDLDKQVYAVEVCRGQIALQRNEKLLVDQDAVKRAIDKGKEKLAGLPTDSTTNTDPEDATRRATAIAGHHVMDRTCAPATEGFSGDATGKKWARSLRSGKGIKFREVWVQHIDGSVTKHTKPVPQVAIYFWPNGTSEKAVIETTDGDPDKSSDGETFSVLVYGLTGRVELMDGMLRDVNDHMMKNAMGDKDAKREDQQ